MEKNPKIFISYSHDSKDHQDRVLKLSDKLRSEGIDCSLDQYEDSPPEGWPKWMDKQVRESDFVLVVCTQTYYNRAMGVDDDGKGIKWESSLIYQHLYNAGANNIKFIPILFSDGIFENIPEPLQGATYYNVDNCDNYNSLYWRLRGVKTKKPELGKLRELPVKERRTLFVSDLIDNEKWEKAKWRNGVAFLIDPMGKLPPVFTVLFDDLDLGKRIFERLIDNVGKVDKNERLRLSVIEGNAPNQDFGYFVVIGENVEATNKILQQSSLDKEIRYVAISQRIHRMKPDKSSKNLSNFKKEVERLGCYYIAPAKQHYDVQKGYHYEVEMDYNILKKKIEFRNYSDIKLKNDPDSILIQEETLKHKF